ncbi:MAG: SLC13 family permease [Rhodothalassiaceae bacterium]
MENRSEPQGSLAGERARYQRIGLWAGPIFAALIYLLPVPDGLDIDAWIVVALGAWMAVWWATEAIPVPVTALLPLIVLPLSGVTTAAAASRPFAEPVIYLLLGGFVMAMALKRWGLERRIALHIVARSGDHPAALLLGFMVASALISMWVSNTATTLMMLPIALSVATTVLGEDTHHHPFAIALYLGIAYAASIGGLGTIIGTPPNAFVVGFIREATGREIAFIEWMAIGVPVVLAMVPAAWAVLVRWSFRFDPDDVRGGHRVVAAALAALGPMRVPERRVAAVFLVAALAWATSILLRQIPGLVHLSDMIIAIAGAVAMFLIPAGDAADPQRRLLDWEATRDLPWGVVLLFGGGLSLAAAIQSTGLADWLGTALAPFAALPLLLQMGLLVLFVIFLTELTSNTATVAALVPILGSLSEAGHFAPALLAVPVALAGSCAFMLPVATGPNAIVYATGEVRVPDMVKAGFRLNLLGTLIITVLGYMLVPLLFGN